MKIEDLLEPTKIIECIRVHYSFNSVDYEECFNEENELLIAAAILKILPLKEINKISTEVCQSLEIPTLPSEQFSKIVHCVLRSNGKVLKDLTAIEDIEDFKNKVIRYLVYQLKAVYLKQLS